MGITQGEMHTVTLCAWLSRLALSGHFSPLFVAIYRKFEVSALKYFMNLVCSVAKATTRVLRWLPEAKTTEFEVCMATCDLYSYGRLLILGGC